VRALPRWVYSGAVLGVQGGTREVVRKLDKVRRAGVSVSALWIQDWVGQRVTSFGKQLWWNWEVDESFYPGWDSLLANWSADGIKTMVYVNP
jgi:sulfoquinovosidase